MMEQLMQIVMWSLTLGFRMLYGVLPKASSRSFKRRQ